MFKQWIKIKQLKQMSFVESTSKLEGLAFKFDSYNFQKNGHKLEVTTTYGSKGDIQSQIVLFNGVLDVETPIGFSIIAAPHIFEDNLPYNSNCCPA